MRYKLIIEYAGTRYSGWQIQKNARTVQGEIDQAVRTVTGRIDFELGGSGRTDAGVHALAQVAHLDVVTSLPDTLLQQRLNAELPADINILAVTRAPRSFHSRHSAQSRRYLYQIAQRRTAFAKPFVWWVKEPLDLVRMREAAGALVGMRDFQSFAVAERRQDDDGDSGPPASTLVAIERVDVVESGDLVLIGIEGSHFLWRMVRRIVGVLVEIGTGRMEVKQMQRLLTSQSDLPAKLTAPASGLFLARVAYPGDPRSLMLEPATPIAQLARN